MQRSVELLVCTHPNELWGVLGASRVLKVTAKYLCGSFAIHYSDSGSNNRTREEAVVYFWYE